MKTTDEQEIQRVEQLLEDCITKAKANGFKLNPYFVFHPGANPPTCCLIGVPIAAGYTEFTSSWDSGDYLQLDHEDLWSLSDGFMESHIVGQPIPLSTPSAFGYAKNISPNENHNH